MKKIFKGLLLFLLALSVFGCSASHQYIKPEDSRHTYSKTYDQVFEAAPQIVKDAKMVLIEVRKNEGVIDVVAPPSFFTSSLGNLMQGGDKVSVVVKKIDEAMSYMNEDPFIVSIIDVLHEKIDDYLDIDDFLNDLIDICNILSEQ